MNFIEVEIDPDDGPDDVIQHILEGIIPEPVKRWAPVSPRELLVQTESNRLFHVEANDDGVLAVTELDAKRILGGLS